MAQRQKKKKRQKKAPKVWGAHGRMTAPARRCARPSATKTGSGGPRVTAGHRATHSGSGFVPGGVDTEKGAVPPPPARGGRVRSSRAAAPHPTAGHARPGAGDRGGPASWLRRLGSRRPRRAGDRLGASRKRGRHNGGETTILDCHLLPPSPGLPAPRRDSRSERDQGHGTERPTEPQRPGRRPAEGYQGRARRDAAGRGRMAADGALGQSLPKRLRARMAAATGTEAGSCLHFRSRALYPPPPSLGLPLSWLSERRRAREVGAGPEAGSGRCGGPPAVRAAGPPLRGARLGSRSRPLRCRR